MILSLFTEECNLYISVGYINLMEKIKIKGKEYNINEDYYVLYEAIMKLAESIEGLRVSMNG